MVPVHCAMISDILLHIGHILHRPHVQVLVVREDDNEIRSRPPCHGIS